MSMMLQPYPKYKNTGVPWLGSVPAHWKVQRLGAVLHERGEVNSEQQINQVLSVLRDVGVILYEEKGNIGNKRSEDITRYKIVRPNDIVVNSMNVIIGSVGISRYTGCLSPVYHVLVPRSSIDNPKYLDSVFQVKPFQKSLVTIGNGILAHRMRIPMDRLKSELIPTPPSEEQDAIVRYIAMISGSVARFIRTKRRLIQVLVEQKQAIIHQAVTRGIDPNVMLKSSGVGWLQEYPEHWVGLPLKRWVATKITDGPHETPPLVDTGVDFLSAESIVNSRFDFDHRRGYISQELHEQYCKKCRPQMHDIFMCKSGATTGKVAIVTTDREFSVWSPLALIRADQRRVVPQLLHLVLQTRYVQHQVQRTWSAGTQPNLSMGAMERLFIVLPPLPEQYVVLESIVRDTMPVDLAIERAQHEIELIREYRTRLIADIVTGKLDVRGVELHAQDDIAALDGLLEEIEDVEESELVEEVADADD